MPRPLRSIYIVLLEARRALHMSTREFGEAAGSSHRTAARWAVGKSIPYEGHLRTIARLVYPHNRTLAAEVADHGNATLADLGLDDPTPRIEDLVADVVLLTAVEHSGLTPALARACLHAVFKRGQELGMTMEAAEKAFRAAAKPRPPKPEK